MRRHVIATALAALAAFASDACAQAWPTRPVTIVVPYAAGGNTDAIARDLGRRLEQRLGQSFIIEQKVGAASVIGAHAVARAAPDGYTILLGTSTTMAINVSVYKNLPYDPTRDLVPVALVAGVPFMLVVNPALPIHSIGDFVKVAKATPGGLSYASNGAGGAAHLFAELIRSRSSDDHVPTRSRRRSRYRGGHVHHVRRLRDALPLVRDGKLRAIGVSTAQPSGPRPDRRWPRSACRASTPRRGR